MNAAASFDVEQVALFHGFLLKMLAAAVAVVAAAAVAAAAVGTYDRELGFEEFVPLNALDKYSAAASVAVVASVVGEVLYTLYHYEAELECCDRSLHRREVLECYCSVL